MILYTARRPWPQRLAHAPRTAWDAYRALRHRRGAARLALRVAWLSLRRRSPEQATLEAHLEALARAGGRP